MKKVLWTVSLSNGETLYENKGNFQMIEGALSPWQRLLSYLAETGTYITSMSLYTDDGKRWNLPSLGRDPKFHEFSVAPKPVGFNFFRKAAIEAKSIEEMKTVPPSDLYTVIEATYENKAKLQLWVDEKKQNCWTLLI